MTKIIEGDLVLKEHTTFNEDLIVNGNIRCEGGIWNLHCGDLNCQDLICGDLNCADLNCKDLHCWNLFCGDLSFYAIAIAYYSFKCNSLETIRYNHVCKCLDGEIEILDKPKVFEKCGQEIK